MKKFTVSGRIRADIGFEETVEAKSDKSAIKMVEHRVYARCGIDSYDVIDDEVYCERVKDERA